nr:hypothetical protein [Tanacetum cinerariifolium]
MENEELSTIPEKESDEVIKSGVEDFVPIPSEFEDTFGSDSECDLPSCDDFSPIDVFEGKYVTFSNPLFNSNDDFTSSDDESLSDKDVPEDNVKIHSNPLFKFDDEYISSDVNPLFDEVLEDIENKVSYDSNLDEPALLVTPLFDTNEDEYLDPGGNVDEINAFDIPSDFEDGYYDSEGDVLPLISLISLNPFVEIPYGASKVHIEVLLLWENKLPIPDGSLPLSRCSWCGGPFNSGNFRHFTNVIFGDEPVYDSNPNSYNQTPDFSNPHPHHNYETDLNSDTRASFQAEFAKLQQDFERFMAQQSCSYCGGPFNGGNYPSCSIVGAGNEFYMTLILFLTIIHPNFMTNHHSTMSRNTRASCVGTILTMVMIVHHDDDDEDDYKESTIPLRDIISQLPQSIVITTSPFVLPTEDPEDSLIMENQELSTIPKKESNEVIKSSVEYFVLILSESEDTSGSDSECDLPSCDDFSSIDILEGKSITFSNPLFDSNDDFTSSDDESPSDENVPKDNVKIHSNPLFEFDDEYISSDKNPLFDEVLEDIESKASYDSNLDEPALLVTLLSDTNEDECFDLGGDVDEINAFDIPLDFEDPYYDSEGDVLYLVSFLSDDTTPNLSPKCKVSSVEYFVLILSESEDTSGSDSECDLPSCDDFPSIDILEGKSITFSNPLFDSNDDFSFSDDESPSDENVPKDNVKIHSNPLFEFDDEYISSDENPLFDEVLEDIESKASYDSNLDEPALLVTLLSNTNEDECFDLGGDVDEINAFDIPSDFEDPYYDSEGDVLYLVSFLSDDTTCNLSPKVFLDHDPRTLSDINDLKIMIKIFDVGISKKYFSPT